MERRISRHGVRDHPYVRRRRHGHSALGSLGGRQPALSRAAQGARDEARRTAFSRALRARSRSVGCDRAHCHRARHLIPGRGKCSQLCVFAKNKADVGVRQTLAYLFAQSVNVFPVVGVNTVAHVKAMPDALRVELSKSDISRLHEASNFKPWFPMSFLYNFRGDRQYDLSLTAADNQQYQMSANIAAPPKPQPYAVSKD